MEHSSGPLIYLSTNRDAWVADIGSAGYIQWYLWVDPGFDSSRRVDGTGFAIAAVHFALALLCPYGIVITGE